MRRPGLLLLTLALLLVAAGGYAAWRQRGVAGGSAAPGMAAGADDSLAMAPPGVRVRVEVLNASNVRGLARRATMRLRDLGYDVVSSGNAGERRDGTLVLVRNGDAEIGERIARGMGGATVESRPDSSRHVDVSVLVGGSWRPPPGPLRP
jgi:hypothetical protein